MPTETEIPEVPDAIKDDPEAVTRWINTWRVKREADAAEEARRVKHFRPTADVIREREGFTIDGARLSEEERRRLKQIIAGSPTEGVLRDGTEVRYRSALNVAAEDRREYEQLIKKAAGRDVFKERREEANQRKVQAMVKETARKGLRKERPKYVDPGTVQAPAFMFNPDWVGLDSEFGIVDYGLFLLIIGLIENHPGVVECVDGAEVHGDELVIDARFFPGAHLLYGVETKAREVIDYLERNKLVSVKKDTADIWRITRGQGLLAEEEAAIVAARRTAA